MSDLVPAYVYNSVDGCTEAVPRFPLYRTMPWSPSSHKSLLQAWRGYDCSLTNIQQGPINEMYLGIGPGYRRSDKIRLYGMWFALYISPAPPPNTIPDVLNWSLCLFPDGFTLPQYVNSSYDGFLTAPLKDRNVSQEVLHEQSSPFQYGVMSPAYTPFARYIAFPEPLVVQYGDIFPETNAIIFDYQRPVRNDPQYPTVYFRSCMYYEDM